MDYYRIAQGNVARWAAAASPHAPRADGACEVLVMPGDWGEVTLALTKRYGATFACLNMANARAPGGGYTDGLASQEEDMFRRSDCHFSLVRERLIKADGSEEYSLTSARF